MKNIFIIIFLFLFVHCSSEDNGDNLPAKLEGVWKITSCSIGGNSQCYYGYDRVEFRGNNKAEFYWEVNENQAEEYSGLSDWIKNGIKLTIEWESNLRQDLILEVTELTNSSLKWKFQLPSGVVVEETFKRQ